MLKRGRLPSSCWAAPASPPFSDQIKMKTSPGLQMKTKRASGLKSLQEWKGPDQWKVSKEEWKGQSQKKESLRRKGIFKDTEKDLDEDAAYVSNVVIGDLLSYTVPLAHWESCGLVCTFQNVFGWAYRFKPSTKGWIRRRRKSLRKGKKMSLSNKSGWFQSFSLGFSLI